MLSLTLSKFLIMCFFCSQTIFGQFSDVQSIDQNRIDKHFLILKNDFNRIIENVEDFTADFFQQIHEATKMVGGGQIEDYNWDDKDRSNQQISTEQNTILKSPTQTPKNLIKKLKSSKFSDEISRRKRDSSMNFPRDRLYVENSNLPDRPVPEKFNMNVDANMRVEAPQNFQRQLIEKSNRIPDDAILSEPLGEKSACAGKTQKEMEMERQKLNDLKLEVKKLTELIAVLKNQQKLIRTLNDMRDDGSVKKINVDDSNGEMVPKQHEEDQSRVTEISNIKQENSPPHTPNQHPAPTYEDLEKLKMDLKTTVEFVNKTKAVLVMEKQHEEKIEEELKRHNSELKFLKIMVENLYDKSKKGTGEEIHKKNDSDKKDEGLKPRSSEFEDLDIDSFLGMQHNPKAMMLSEAFTHKPITQIPRNHPIFPFGSMSIKKWRKDKDDEAKYKEEVDAHRPSWIAGNESLTKEWRNSLSRANNNPNKESDMRRLLTVLGHTPSNQNDKTIPINTEDKLNNQESEHKIAQNEENLNNKPEQNSLQATNARASSSAKSDDLEFKLKLIDMLTNSKGREDTEKAKEKRLNEAMEKLFFSSEKKKEERSILDELMALTNEKKEDVKESKNGIGQADLVKFLRNIGAKPQSKTDEGDIENELRQLQIAINSLRPKEDELNNGNNKVRDEAQDFQAMLNKLIIQNGGVPNTQTQLSPNLPIDTSSLGINTLAKPTAILNPGNNPIKYGAPIQFGSTYGMGQTSYPNEYKSYPGLYPNLDQYSPHNYGSNLNPYGATPAVYGSNSNGYAIGPSYSSNSNLNPLGPKLTGYGSNINAYGQSVNAYGSNTNSYGPNQNSYSFNSNGYGSNFNNYGHGYEGSNYGGNSYQNTQANVLDNGPYSTTGFNSKYGSSTPYNYENQPSYNGDINYASTGPSYGSKTPNINSYGSTITIPNTQTYGGSKTGNQGQNGYQNTPNYAKNGYSVPNYSTATYGNAPQSSGPQNFAYGVSNTPIVPYQPQINPPKPSYNPSSYKPPFFLSPSEPGSSGGAPQGYNYSPGNSVGSYIGQSYYPPQNSQYEDPYKYSMVNDLNKEIESLESVITGLNRADYSQTVEDKATIASLEQKIYELKGVINGLKSPTSQYGTPQGSYRGSYGSNTQQGMQKVGENPVYQSQRPIDASYKDKTTYLQPQPSYQPPQSTYNSGAQTGLNQAAYSTSGGAYNTNQGSYNQNQGENHPIKQEPYVPSPPYSPNKVNQSPGYVSGPSPQSNPPNYVDNQVHSEAQAMVPNYQGPPQPQNSGAGSYDSTPPPQSYQPKASSNADRDMSPNRIFMKNKLKAIKKRSRDKRDIVEGQNIQKESSVPASMSLNLRQNFDEGPRRDNRYEFGEDSLTQIANIFKKYLEENLQESIEESPQIQPQMNQQNNLAPQNPINRNNALDNLTEKLNFLKKQLESPKQSSRAFSDYFGSPGMTYGGYNSNNYNAQPQYSTGTSTKLVPKISDKKQDIFTKIVLKILDKIINTLPAVLFKLFGKFGSSVGNSYGDSYSPLQSVFKNMGAMGYFPLIFVKMFDTITVLCKSLRKNQFFKKLALPGISLGLAGGVIMFLIYFYQEDDNYGYIDYHNNGEYSKIQHDYSYYDKSPPSHGNYGPPYQNDYRSNPDGPTDSNAYAYPTGNFRNNDVTGYRGPIPYGTNQNFQVSSSMPYTRGYFDYFRNNNENRGNVIYR